MDLAVTQFSRLDPNATTALTTTMVIENITDCYLTVMSGWQSTLGISVDPMKHARTLIVWYKSQI